MTYKLRSILPVMLCLCSFVMADDFTLLRPGPFGRPILVNDETENISVPIRIYKDPDTELFIPDITTSGWLAWHAREYRNDGRYSVLLYSFYKTEHGCQLVFKPSGERGISLCSQIRYQRRHITVDTRNKTLTIYLQSFLNRDGFADPAMTNRRVQKLRIADVSPGLRTAINNISAIVNREIANYHGPTTSFEQSRCESAIEATMNMANSLNDPKIKQEEQRLRAKGCQ